MREQQHRMGVADRARLHLTGHNHSEEREMRLTTEHMIYLLCAMALAMIAAAWPVQPGPMNELTIRVYRDYTEFIDNGEHVLTVVDCDYDREILSQNGHRCTDELALLEELIEGYVPLPWHMLEFWTDRR